MIRQLLVYIWSERGFGMSNCHNKKLKEKALQKMSPKEFIEYTKWLDKKGLAICDGTTENVGGAFNILYPIFIITGISIFAWILMRWTRFKEKKNNGRN